MQVKLERGVLPAGHVRHTNALLTQRIIDVQKNGAAAQERLNASLDSLVEEEAPWVRPGIGNCGEQVAGVHFVVDISVAAHTLDRASALQPAEAEDACECYGVINRMVCTWLTGRLQAAPPDGLLDIAEVPIDYVNVFDMPASFDMMLPHCLLYVFGDLVHLD